MAFWKGWKGDLQRLGIKRWLWITWSKNFRSPILNILYPKSDMSSLSSARCCFFFVPLGLNPDPLGSFFKAGITLGKRCRQCRRCLRKHLRWWHHDLRPRWSTQGYQVMNEAHDGILHTVDGSEILHHLGCISKGILVFFGGAGFCPSTVWLQNGMGSGDFLLELNMRFLKKWENSGWTLVFQAPFWFGHLGLRGCLLFLFHFQRPYTYLKFCEGHQLLFPTKVNGYSFPSFFAEIFKEPLGPAEIRHVNFFWWDFGRITGGWL